MILPALGSFRGLFLIFEVLEASPIYQTVDSFHRNADIDFHNGAAFSLKQNRIA